MRSAVYASCVLLVIIIRLMVCEFSPSGLDKRAIVTILFRSQNGSGHDRDRPRVGMVRQGPGCIDGIGGAEYQSPTCVLPNPRMVESCDTTHPSGYPVPIGIDGTFGIWEPTGHMAAVPVLRCCQAVRSGTTSPAWL